MSCSVSAKGMKGEGNSLLLLAKSRHNSLMEVPPIIQKAENVWCSSSVQENAVLFITSWVFVGI